MRAASNSRECWEETIGKRVVGVLMGALPVDNAEIASRCKSLIFEDGTALTVSSSFWMERADDVKRAVRRKADELASVDGDLRRVLATARAVDV